MTRYIFGDNLDWDKTDKKGWKEGRRTTLRRAIKRISGDRNMNYKQAKIADSAKVAKKLF